MTREEAKAVITGHLDHWNRLLKEKICDPTEGVDTTEAFKVAIELLEQEPCEDAISRQGVIDALTKTSGIRGDALKALYDLPHVTPQPKIGHWEHGREVSRVFIGDALRGINYEDWHCSNCHCVVEQSIKPKWHYCPNCGAKMQEVEENGDK